MKIKVVSDGTPLGTKVFTEDGKVIDDIQAIEYYVSVEETGRLTLLVYNVPVELTAIPSLIVPKREGFFKRLVQKFC